ncbi:kinase-like domain-containing protein [Tuber brumale]|nr:kinase-like domain-containing protein [Tuber brumale]
MDRDQSDLVEWYRIETEFFQDHVRHTRNVEEARLRNERVKEVWHNDEELGRGGFGVVHKQIQKATGLCRAVKTIDKTGLSANLDYTRELLVMAILAKCPTLFVKFLGWFEEPTSLYIAMEYLEQGDLTKHIGKPLPQETVRNISAQILEGLEAMHHQKMAHRDLKPANIFVVSMSPVWVKLGDFGISKRIRGAATDFRTQAFTAAYSAPEVQGLDSSSETSVYTNSVDIWSLGCVIYELLVGTMLFPGEGDVARYFFGRSPFPEDKLKGLSSPTDDVGISLLKSMLAIQPGGRPNATDALKDAWLVDLEYVGGSGDGQGETPQRRYGSTRSRGGGNKLTTRDRPKEGGRILASRGNTEHTATSAASRVDPGNDPAVPESAIGAAILTSPGAAPVEGPSTREGPPKLEPTADAPQSPRDPSQEPEGANEEMDPQYPAILSSGSSTSDPLTPDPHNGNGPQLTPGTNGLEPAPNHNGPASALDVPTTTIAHRRTYPTRKSRFRSDDSETSEDEVSPNATPAPNGTGGEGRGDAAANPLNNSNTEQSSDAGQDPDAEQNSDAEQDPDAGQNPDAGQDPIAGSNTNQNPNVGLNSNSDGDRTAGRELGTGGNPDIGWSPNAGGNIGLNPHLVLNPSLLVTDPRSG